MTNAIYMTMEYTVTLMVITRYKLRSFWGESAEKSHNRNTALVPPTIIRDLTPRKIREWQNCPRTPNYNSRFKIQVIKNLSKIHNKKNCSKIQTIKTHLKIQN